MSLSSAAMIVTLNVSCWTARKQDKKVTAEVDRLHSAQDAGRYNKLLVDKAHLDPLTSMAGKIRNEHYKFTLPWMDNGGRLLPTKHFLDYKKAMAKLKADYEQLVEAFIAKYDAHLIADARRRLGTMYDPEDYPPGSDLRRKFGLDMAIMPVPQSGDFRVDIDEAERARIQADIAERLEQQQREAMNEAWSRVRTCVSTICERTSAKKTCIRDSLMENAEELVRLLPGLNVVNDPALTAITEAISKNLIVNVSRLRDSASTRKAIAAAAQDILDRIPEQS